MQVGGSRIVMMLLGSRGIQSDWVRCQSYSSIHTTYAWSIGYERYQYFTPLILHSKVYLLVRCCGALPINIWPIYYDTHAHKPIQYSHDAYYWYTSPMSSPFDISIPLTKPLPAPAILLSIIYDVVQRMWVWRARGWFVWTWPWGMGWCGCVALLWHPLLVRWWHEGGLSPNTYISLWLSERESVTSDKVALRCSTCVWSLAELRLRVAGSAV